MEKNGGQEMEKHGTVKGNGVAFRMRLEEITKDLDLVDSDTIKESDKLLKELRRKIHVRLTESEKTEKKV